MEELYLNDQLVDIIPNTIRQTKQVNTVADMASRQVSYTNQFKLPRTKRNLKVLKSLSFVGSTSNLPYSKVKAELLQGGIPLIRNGVARIENTTSEYTNIVIYDGAITLKTLLKDKNLNDLDFNYLGNVNFTDGILSTENYTYAVYDTLFKDGGLNEEDFVFLNNGAIKYDKNKNVPLLYVRDLVIQIFKQNNFTVNGELFSNEEFKKEVISLKKIFINNMNESMHDIECLKFVKDVLFRYGQYYIINESVITFYSTNSLLKGSSGFEDWSTKYNSSKKTKYRSNYGQKNNVKFESEPTIDGVYSVVSGHSFRPFDAVWNDPQEISDEHLKVENSVYEWIYPKSGIVIRHGVFENDISAVYFFDRLIVENTDPNTGDVTYTTTYPPSDNDTNMRLLKVSKWTTSLFQVYSISSPQQMLVCDEEKTTPYYYLSTYHQEFFKMMNNYELHEVELNLSIVDIHQLDFTKLKYIEQLGGYFYLNKVKDWQNGKLTKVELVKVYPNVNNQGGTVPQVNNQGLGNALEMELG